MYLLPVKRNIPLRKTPYSHKALPKLNDKIVNLKSLQSTLNSSLSQQVKVQNQVINVTIISKTIEVVSSLISKIQS